MGEKGKNETNDDKTVPLEEEEEEEEKKKIVDLDDDDDRSNDSNLTPLSKYVHADGIPKTLSLSRSAIESLVRWYCREAGVRNLAKYIDQITRKLALQYVAENMLHDDDERDNDYDDDEEKKEEKMISKKDRIEFVLNEKTQRKSDTYC